MLKDKFKTYGPDLAGSASDARAVIPNDTQSLQEVTVGLNVATLGQVRVTTKDGSIADLTISAGTPFPIRVSKVWQTGTTATGIVALY